jgi:hypothetical protein
VSGSNDTFISLFKKIVNLTSSRAVGVYIYGDRFFLNLVILIIGKILRWKLVYDFVEYRKYRLHYISIRKKILVLLSNYLIPLFSDKVVLLGKAPDFVSENQIIYQPIYPVELIPSQFQLQFIHGDFKKNILYNGDFDSKENLEMMKDFVRNIPTEIFTFSFVTKKKRSDVIHVSTFFESYAKDFLYECPIDYRNEMLRSHHYVLLFRGNNEENRYSFPTRVVDFIKHGLVIVTNHCAEMNYFFCDNECIFYSREFSLDDYISLSNNKNYLIHKKKSLYKLSNLTTDSLINYLQ